MSKFNEIQYTPRSGDQTSEVQTIEQSIDPVSDKRTQQLNEIRSLIHQDKQLSEFNGKEAPPVVDKQADEERRARHQKRKEEERAARKAAERQA